MSAPPSVTLAPPSFDAFLAAGYEVGYVNESRTSPTCSRPGCAQGVCADEWLYVAGGASHVVHAAARRDDRSQTIYTRDENADRDR